MDVNLLREELIKLKNEEKQIKKELDSYVFYYSELQSFMGNVQNNLDYLNNILITLELIKENYNKEQIIRAKEMEFINNHIYELKRKHNELLNSLRQQESIITQSQLEVFCTKCLDLNDDNSIKFNLERNTYTTPLLDDFYKSGKEFLILNAGMKLQDDVNFSFILVKTNTILEGSELDIPSFSELKSQANKNIRNINKEKLTIIKGEIIRAVTNKRNCKSNIIPFYNSCKISASVINGQNDLLMIVGIIID